MYKRSKSVRFNAKQRTPVSAHQNFALKWREAVEKLKHAEKEWKEKFNLQKEHFHHQLKQLQEEMYHHGFSEALKEYTKKDAEKMKAMAAAEATFEKMYALKNKKMQNKKKNSKRAKSSNTLSSITPSVKITSAKKSTKTSISKKKPDNKSPKKSMGEKSKNAPKKVISKTVSKKNKNSAPAKSSTLHQMISNPESTSKVE